MNYIVRLTFHSGNALQDFIRVSQAPNNVINDRCVVYSFKSVGAAFMFLCLVAKQTAFIADTACYTSIDGQKDFK